MRILQRLALKRRWQTLFINEHGRLPRISAISEYVRTLKATISNKRPFSNKLSLRFLIVLLLGIMKTYSITSLHNF